ncbi:hypothetical protein [Spirosoma sp.]|uniref:hypothetical protein n=1 Tax=Spirosoma sp. TaxID=1899569 RepID=UPI003B3A31B3
MSIFTKDAGRILDIQETEAMKGAYRKRKVEVGLKADEYVQSEFFGIEQVQRLLNLPGCVGLRIHQAKRWEDANGRPSEAGEGQLIPRVLLTGVDAKGKDIPILDDKSGLKDMPAGAGSMRALGDGPVCPPHCKN